MLENHSSQGSRCPVPCPWSQNSGQPRPPWGLKSATSGLALSLRDILPHCLPRNTGGGFGANEPWKIPVGPLTVLDAIGQLL